DANGNPLSSGSTAPDGQLYLTLGRGDVRRFNPDDQDETYSVSHVSTQADGSETVSVLYNGRTATFKGVRQILTTGAGSGNETLYVNPGVTAQLNLRGGSGNDSFLLAGGSTSLMNLVNAGAGDDIVQVVGGNPAIRYDIAGGSGFNQLYGGPGDDTLRAGPGVDQIYGGLGNDTLFSGTGIAYIFGEEGSIQEITSQGVVVGQSMTSSGAAGGDDTVYASSGTNYIIGGAGSDRIFGGGANYVIGDNGEIDFSGFLDASNRLAGVTITSLSSTEPGVGGNDYISNAGVGAPLYAIGGAGADTLVGGSGNDLVLGDGGRITFSGGAPTHVDLLDEAYGGNDSISLGEGDNQAYGGAGNDSLTGGGGSDVLWGGSGDDLLSGGAGSDTLAGGLGNDTILGGEGNDVILWGAGDGVDSVDGGAGGAGGADLLRVTLTNGDDTVQYARWGAGFSVQVGPVVALTLLKVESSELYALAGRDTLTVNPLGTSSLTTLHAFLGEDAVADSVIVNGTTSDDSMVISAVGNTVTLNPKAGVAIIVEDAQSPKGGASFTVNLGDGNDSVRVNQTLAGTTTTLNGGTGDDLFNVRGIGGPTTLNGGKGSDTINVGSLAQGDATTAPTNTGGNVNSIGAVLAVNGETAESGIDVLNVDETGDTGVNAGILTASTISGLGMAGSIEYGTVEAVNVSLGTGFNTFSVRSTAAATTTTVTSGIARVGVTGVTNTPNPTITTAGPHGLAPGQLISITGVSGATGVNGNYVVMALDPVHPDTQFTIALANPPGAFQGGGTAGTVQVRNVLNVGGLAPGIGGVVDGVQGLLIFRGSGADLLAVDDTGSTAAKTGQLTATTLTGLGMGAQGIRYDGMTDLALSLGHGGDHFFIQGTAAGATTVLNSGDEPDSDNLVNDVVNINSVAGPTTVNAGSGNDVVRVNYDEGGNQTFLNGVGALLTIHGQGGSDLVEIGLAGFGQSTVAVSDNSTDGRPNRLKIYGTPRNDLFLFRPYVVAALGLAPSGALTGRAEKVRYDSSMNDVAVYGADGDDKFVLDDTSSALTLYGDAGDDTFQVGQMFQSSRDAANAFNGLTAEDAYGTTLTTRGYLSNGNGAGNPTTIYGGIGKDSFTVYHNNADLFLFGEEDDDTFTVRAFVKVDPSDPKAPSTNINGGQGADFVSYTVNAPVNIEGGDGFDTLTVLGTEFGDDFVVTDKGILGAGLYVRYGSIERVVLDALEGNDTFFIQSTAAGVDVEVYGGLGSDTFKVGGGNDGQAITVVANDLLGHSGLVIHRTTSADPRYLGVFAHGVSANVADSDAAGVVINMISGPIRVFESPSQEEVAGGLVHATYSVVLTRSPLETVQVTAVPTLPTRQEQRAGGLGVALNGRLDGTSLFFDRTNWFIPQIITVTAPDDVLAEGLRRINIQHSVKQGGSADDGGEYDRLSLPTVVAEVIDNDAAGVLVAGARDGNVVAEAGRNATTSAYQVVLTRAPSGNVVIDLSHDLHLATQGPASGSLLTFTPQDWYIPQTVTISAVDDNSAQGLIYSRIAHQLDLTGRNGAGTLDGYLALGLGDVARGLAAELSGDSVAQLQVTILPGSGGTTITVTAPNLSPIDARSFSPSLVSLGGDATESNRFKDVVLGGTAAKDDLWSLTVTDSAGQVTDTFSYLVRADGESLESVARNLRDQINAGRQVGAGTADSRQVKDFTASVLGTTLTIRRNDGAALLLAAAVTGPRSLGTVSVQRVLTYTQLTLTVAGGVTSGRQWQVVLNGTTYTYTAGDNGESTDVSSLDVQVLDRSVAGVFVRETGGSTQVTEPTDIVLLGSGQVTPASSGSGALVHIVAGADSPALLASVSITSAGLKASAARATLSGSAVWLEATVTLEGDPSSYPLWELTLNGPGGTQVYSAPSSTLNLVQTLVDRVNRGGIYTATQTGGSAFKLVLKDHANVGFAAQMTQGRASIAGSAAWRVLNIAFSGTVAADDTVKLDLKAAGGIATSYTAASGTSLTAIAAELAAKVLSTPPTGVVVAGSDSSRLTQFIGDFGTSVMSETPSHDSAVTAQPIDFGNWGTSSNPDIENATTIPHLTIRGTGNGETDFYQFDITTEMARLGTAAQFDIDHGFDGTGILWGAQLQLFRIATNSDGAKVAVPVLGADRLPVVSAPFSSSLDAGSSTVLDGSLKYTFSQAGTYAIQVTNWLGPKYSVSHSIGLPTGVRYDLNVSIPGHSVAKFTFAAVPVLEDKSQQNTGGQVAGQVDPTAAQGVDDARLWFTFADDTIGNGSTITSGVPYVTILGSGNGSYDDYRFTITQEMLTRQQPTLDGTLDTHAPYYRSVDLVLTGSIGAGDLWTVSVNGHDFTYTAKSGDTLASVASGIVAAYAQYAGQKPGLQAPTYAITSPGAASTLRIVDPTNGFWIKLHQSVASAATVTRRLSTLGDVPFDTVQMVLSGTPSVGEVWSVLLGGVVSRYTTVVQAVAPAGGAQTLDDVGRAMAALNGDSSGGVATYDSTLHILKLTGLGGVGVGFQVVGSHPSGSVALSGTPVQDPAANATASAATGTEAFQMTRADVQFAGATAHNQVFTLTLTDESGSVLTSTATVGLLNGVPESAAQAITHFSTVAGYTLTANGATLTIVRTVAGSKGFQVDVRVSEAASGGTVVTTGTPSYYSLARLTLAGAATAGETWAIQLTEADGTIRTASYQVGTGGTNGDLTGDGRITLEDVAQGLRLAVGSAATRDGTSLTLSKPAGLRLVPTAPAGSSLTLVAATSQASHWSVADIEFRDSSPVSLGETWTLVLTRPDGTVLTNPSGTPVGVSYAVQDATGDGVLDVKDVAKGLAALIPGATASGAVLHYVDSGGPGVQATLVVKPAPVVVTATLGGAYASAWTQTVQFTGGTGGGASAPGDQWTMVIDGKTYPGSAGYVATENGFATVAAGFFQALQADYVATAPTDATLSLRSRTGAVMEISAVRQERDRTTELVDGSATAVRDATPHYARVLLTLDPSMSLTVGELWQVVLNGHAFQYSVASGDNVNGVAQGLLGEIIKAGTYSVTRSGSTLTVTPNTQAAFTGIVVDSRQGDGSVTALFDIDNANSVRGYAFEFQSLFSRFLFPYTDTLFLQVYGPGTGPGATSTLLTPSSTTSGLAGTPDPGSTSTADPFQTYRFTRAGDYVVRVGAHRHFDPGQGMQDKDLGVSQGISYQLNISIQHHALNTSAVDLVGKQISITAGAGQGQSARILAYDANSKTYTLDQNWATAVNETSQFDITYHIQQEFSGYAANSDSYSMVLTSLPGANVTIDVLPQVTRTYNSSLAFVPAANYGENSAVQVRAATPQALVELAGTPRVGQRWTLTLNGIPYSFDILTAADATLEKVAQGLRDRINNPPAGTPSLGSNGEHYVALAGATPGWLVILSSTYQTLLNTPGATGSPTPFTAEFGVTAVPGAGVAVVPAGALIDPQDGIGGWFRAKVQLLGTVDQGSIWTLRLDGTDYSYTAKSGDDLHAIALGLSRLLPAVYGAVADATAGRLQLTDSILFKISFRYTPATVVRPQLVFTPSTWDQPQNVVLTAIHDNIVDGSDAKVIAAEDSRINTIRGPLTLDGGDPVGLNTDLNHPYLMPGEKNDVTPDGRVSTFGTDADGNAFLTDVAATHVDPTRVDGVLAAGFDPRMNGNAYQFTLLTGSAAGVHLRVKSVSADGTTVTFEGGWPGGTLPASGDAYYYAPINPNVLVNEATQVDAAVIDNHNSPAADVGTLTESRLFGFGMGGDTVVGPKTLQGGITYRNLETLDIELGFGGNDVTILSTHAGSTTLHSGAGNDLFHVLSLLGHTTIDTGSGADFVDVGSPQHLLNEVGGLLTVVGQAGQQILHVDDSANQAGATGTLTASTLTGLGL
ncbi:MAG TPA: hypothetical protein DCM86_10365, partial [Verrucomicrobiales bacterium]|nr:hypothetical protein [Verrucomicrobiales bacterium]